MRDADGLVLDEGLLKQADFFIELSAVLSDRNVRRMNWFRREKFTSQMLERYSSGHLKAVTDFRKVKQHINIAIKSGKSRTISDRLREFAEEPALPVEHLAIQSAAITAKVREITMTVKKLEQMLRHLNAADYYGEEALWSRLEALVELIRVRLAEVERRTR